MSKIPTQTIPDKFNNLSRYASRNESRNKIEADKNVQAIIDSGKILTPAFNSLLYSLLVKTKTIDSNLLTLRDDKLITSSEVSKKITTLTVEKFKKYTADSLANDVQPTEQQMDEKIAEYLKETTEDELGKERNGILKKIIETSHQIDEEINVYLEKESLPNLDIIHKIIIYVCKKCGRINSENFLKMKKCKCGEKLDHEKVLEKVISIFNTNAQAFIVNNMWLEHGIEKLFVSLGFNTLCGYNVLGSSNVSHEIDVIAEDHKKGKLIIECKATAIDINEVFKLAGKIRDIGCYRGYMFTTATLADINKDVISLANANNIKIVTGVLEKKEDQLLAHLKSIEDSQSI